MHTIDWNQFQAVDLRAGTITHAETFPEARQPAYKLTVDFGPDVGILQSSAQITQHYTPQTLIGRQVLAVVNLPAKRIGPVRSQCLVTGFCDADGAVVLVGPDQPVPNGTRLG